MPPGESDKAMADFASPRLCIVSEFPFGDVAGGPDPTRPIPEMPKTQSVLRSLLVKSFPVKVRARRAIDGTATLLSQDQCETAFARLRAHAAAYVELHRWGTQQPRTSRTPSVAVTFWHSPGNGGVDPICPDVVVTGLQSAATHFDVVELLCYQPFAREYLTNQVPSLRAFDASEYLSEAEFKQLFEQGVGIRTLADAVRVRRLLRRGGGWFVDCDCHWMRRIGTIDMRPPQFGHLFCDHGSAPDFIENVC